LPVIQESTMKLFVFISLFLFSVLSIGQTTNYIVNEHGLWSTLETHCLPNGTNYSTYYIKFEGDTVIDEYEYKRIWRCDEESQQDWNFYGFIRENENNQVFLRPPNYIEGLIYDFNVGLGDSVEAVNLYLNSDTLHFMVSAVDSVFLHDKYRKRIHLHEYINNKQEVWIEGVGSLFGILNSCNDSYGSVCGGYESLCYEESGDLIYQHPNYLTCYYEMTVGTDNREMGSINIYPNPASGYVTFDFPDQEKAEIEIIDLNGKKIIKKFAYRGKNILYLHEVESGVYFINVLSNKRYYPPYKLIVD
jgi:hypothetical protein